MSESAQEHEHLPGELDQECLEWCPICRTADFVRGLSPELNEQVREVQREGLSILRAAIDLYIQHLEDEPPPKAAERADREGPA